MVSAIDPSKPADEAPASKEDLRANLAAAKSEIEALQAGSATAYTHPKTGGVQRTLGQLAVDLGLNAKDFGALGDGTGTTIQDWRTDGSLDRGFDDLAAIQAVYPHAEALSDTIDWVVLQHCCDLAATPTLATSKVYLPAGRYVINRTLQVTRGKKTFDSAQLIGETRFSEDQAGTLIDATAFLNAPAIAVSGARYVELRDFAVLGGNGNALGIAAPSDVENDWVAAGCTSGPFNPYTGIAIDPYAGPTPGSPFPLAAGESYGRPRFSNQVRISGVSVRGFVVGIAQSPSNNDIQGDFLRLDHCEINHCAYGFASGGTQNRDLVITGGQISWCREALVTTRFGNGKGNLPYCFGLGGFALYRVIKATSRWMSGYICGGRFEAIHEIGEWAGGFQSDHHPLTFQACDFAFDLDGWAPRPAIKLYAGAPVRFTGCSFLAAYAAPYAGVFNIAGDTAGEVDFESCFFNTPSSWEDQFYIAENGNFGTPRVSISAGSFSAPYMVPAANSWQWGVGRTPVGQNSHEKRRASLPARLELNGHSRSLETNTAPYWVQLGDPAPTSGASGYNHGTTGQLTFTASTPADFVAYTDGDVPGDLLYWQTTTYGYKLVPMLRVTGISGSTITCEKLFSDDQYDQSYNPASVQFAPRQWAPGVPLSGTLTTGTANLTGVTNAAAVLRPGDFLTADSGLAANTRVTAISGTTVTLSQHATETAVHNLYFARLRRLAMI